MLTKQNVKKALALHVQKFLLAQGIICFLLVVTVVYNFSSDSFPHANLVNLVNFTLGATFRQHAIDKMCMYSKSCFYKS
jgi:hypothetical protein